MMCTLYSVSRTQKENFAHLLETVCRLLAVDKAKLSQPDVHREECSCMCIHYCVQVLSWGYFTIPAFNSCSDILKISLSLSSCSCTHVMQWDSCSPMLDLHATSTWVSTTVYCLGVLYKSCLNSHVVTFWESVFPSSLSSCSCFIGMNSLSFVSLWILIESGLIFITWMIITSTKSCCKRNPRVCNRQSWMLLRWILSFYASTGARNHVTMFYTWSFSGKIYPWFYFSEFFNRHLSLWVIDIRSNWRWTRLQEKAQVETKTYGDQQAEVLSRKKAGHSTANNRDHWQCSCTSMCTV